MSDSTKQSDKDKKAEAAAKAAAKKEAAEKKAAAKEKAAKEREAKREAARVAKEKAAREERQTQIDSGALITAKEGDLEVEYHRVESKSKDVLDQRAVKVLAALEKSKTPLLGKELQEEFGGGWPLYIPMFSMLKAQGLIVEYRRRTGERGGGGAAYLHTKHVKG